MQNQLASRVGRLKSQFKDFTECASLARAQTGKSWRDQLQEIRALRKYGGQCGISDYYWCKLYDDDYQLGRGAPDYLGWRLQEQFSLVLNPRSAVLPAWDKCVFTVLATSAGLPVAPIRACYHPSGRISDTLGIHLKSKSEVATYLRDPSIYPLFSKPAYSQQAYGTAYLAAYDASSDTLALPNGKTVSIESFLSRLDETIDRRYHRPECGFLFQEALTSAAEIQALTNWPAVCGVRVVCLNGPDGVKPIRALWKIAVPPNQVDNFSMGKYGNLLADVELTNGEINRVLSGFWPNTQVITTHPYSGQSLTGFRLPGWDRILDICRRAGAVFPLMKIHHWDFALTDRGPMILELNDLGGTIGEQIHGWGLLTEETREFIKRYGTTQQNPWIRLL
ncbi:sugar-transfer associated ATP-grasp domain-containing protein [Propionivibrio sp.]|uniref:sugar-transfer associated ATP-grasp domain-containing protein n=1 Tax=Propionivibrio sp. TaxID=2212460 RepID=UPI0025CEC61E|nr:sugar-transfer associated ATP-grasp domain-containing protein [Propionivibrio sp.]MBK7356815.1 hypothetical protein [Propionivibrio sp.]MBK8744501.1 hypothetical protein [Propionivibrio sp.]MBK8894993.1 hypothetical protein [Propionivibrio sp.]MBL0208244.1 hypothetical protein [Propionivibrio sp.]